MATCKASSHSLYGSIHHASKEKEKKNGSIFGPTMGQEGLQKELESSTCRRESPKELKASMDLSNKLEGTPRCSKHETPQAREARNSASKSESDHETAMLKYSQNKGTTMNPKQSEWSRTSGERRRPQPQYYGGQYQGLEKINHVGTSYRPWTMQRRQEATSGSEL